MLIDSLVHPLLFNFPNILVLVAFHAYAQIDSVFGPAIRSVSHFVFLSSPACKKLGVNHVVAAQAVTPPITRAAAAKFRFSFADNLASTNFCLTYEVPQVRVSFVTYHRSFGEFGCCVGIYLKVVPCGADDFIEIR